MTYKVKVYHLYPDAMNLYGDLGNVLALKKRCEWRGLEFEVVDVKIGDKIDFSDCDILFMGGGQDSGQKIVAEDLVRRGDEIRERVEDGMVALTVCGGFQLFGEFFKTKDGTKITGIGVFDAYTVAGDKRLIGNVVADISQTAAEWSAKFKSKPSKDSQLTLVGFENHSGLTHLGPKTKPLGIVIKGYGNKGDGGYEGGYYKNAFGTYLHGSLLPKNPEFCDHLIRTALFNRYGALVPLDALDDSLEDKAHKTAERRAKTAKTLSI